MEKKIDYFPHSESEQKKIEPIYEVHEGWVESTQRARSWSELPALAIKFVRRIEEVLETPISILSTSPRREDTILVKIHLVINKFFFIIYVFYNFS